MGGVHSVVGYSSVVSFVSLYRRPSTIEFSISTFLYFSPEKTGSGFYIIECEVY